MDVTGCPGGYATDVVLFYDRTPLRCDMSVAVWIFFGVCISLLKFLTAMGHSYMWLRRRRLLRKRNVRSKGRLPLIPLLSWLFFGLILLFFCLTFANVINATNGVTSLLFGLDWSCFGVLSSGYLVKFVNLGNRILPKSKPIADAQSLDSSRETHALNQPSLNRFDAKGKFIFVLMQIALLGQMLAYCVFGMVFANEYITVRIANGLQGIYLFLLQISLVNQLERIKWVVRTTRDKNRENASPQASADLDAVLTRLTQQEISFSTAMVPMILFHALIVFEALYTRYYIFSLFFWADALGSFFVMLSNLRTSRKRKDGDKQQMVIIAADTGSGNSFKVLTSTVANTS